MSASESLASRTHNQEKVAQLTKVLGELVAIACYRGSFGTYAVEFDVKDGSILTVRRKTEERMM